MADTVSKLATVHVEIKHLSSDLTSYKSSMEDLRKDFKVINDKVISNSIQADEYKRNSKKNSCSISKE